MGILPRIFTVILDHRDHRRNVDSIAIPFPKYIYLASDLAYWLVRNKWPHVETRRRQARLAQKLPLIPNVTTLDAEAITYDLLRRGILRSNASNKLGFAADAMRNYLAAKGIIQADDIGYVITQRIKQICATSYSWSLYMHLPSNSANCSMESGRDVNMRQITVSSFSSWKPHAKSSRCSVSDSPPRI